MYLCTIYTYNIYHRDEKRGVRDWYINSVVFVTKNIMVLLNLFAKRLDAFLFNEKLVTVSI